MRSDTVSVTIAASPQRVYDFVSDINNWPQFSDFAPSVESRGEYWIIHNSQGDIKLTPQFSKDLLLLDSTVTMPSGEEVFIPYRVVPNESGSELIMTNFKAPQDSDEAYEEQVRWMKEELEKVRKLLENQAH